MKFKTISMLLISSTMSLALVNGQEQLKSISSSQGTVFEDLRGKNIHAEISETQLLQLLGLSNGNSFKVVKRYTDKLGITHTNFQQYFNDVEVEGAVIMVHAKNGVLQSINGKYESIASLNTNANIDDLKAADIAKESLQIVSLIRNYAPEKKIIMDPETQEPKVTFAVRVDGRLANGLVEMKRAYVDVISGQVIDLLPVNAHADVPATAHTFFSGVRTITTDFDGNNTYRLYDNARKIHTLDATNADMGSSWNDPIFTNPKEVTNSSTDWQRTLGISRSRLSVATNTIMNGLNSTTRPVGAILEKETNDISPDIASWPVVIYSNSFPVMARGFYHPIKPNTQYFGVFAKANLNNGNVVDTITFPIDSHFVGTFNWADTNGNSGTYMIDSFANQALDVHWGITKTYDYYLDKFDRASFDGNGTKITNYVNGVFPFIGSSNNAMALESPYNAMVYGMGDGAYTNPFVALDVTGHEFTHLVIGSNGNGGLRYRNESGALNESFADMFGVSIDFYAHDTLANWLIGEDVYIGNDYMRSLANPKSKFNPDTYKGQYWVTGNDDNGGVHTNSSVPNYWFYLVAKGGSGTNDNGYAYNVTGISLEKAEQIAYRTLMNYLNYNATFQDAYNGSLQAVRDLYGNDTNSVEYTTVKEAWYAVGLGLGGPTSITKVNTTNEKVDIFPNPSSGAAINFKSELNAAFEVNVVNALGQVVKKVNVQKGVNTIPVAGLAKGMYTFVFTVEGQQYAHKVSLY
jgi:Zn-dependent metalloprotease